MLCKTYNIKPETPFLIGHSEGAALGVASNHSDPMHWFPRHGKNLDAFRSDVKKEMEAVSSAFDNIPADWAKDGVEWAVKNGLLVGDEKGDFRLRDYLTREQMCVILHRLNA